MSSDTWKPECVRCGVDRRQFLKTGCALCAGTVGSLTLPSVSRAVTDRPPVRIRIVYALHGEQQTVPDWPNIGFDFRPPMERITRGLTERCDGFEFLVSMANGAEQTAAILEQDAGAGIDGYIVCQMNCWNQVVQTLAASGKPVLYVDFMFAGSGGFLVYTARFLREGTPNVGFVASPRIEDLVAAVRCFEPVVRGGAADDFAAAVMRVRTAATAAPGDLTCFPDPLTTISPQECLRRMSESPILAVRDQEARAADPIMGIPVKFLAFSEINAAWEAADRDAAREIADRWERTAMIVSGVSRETLETSAAMYLGMKEVLARHGAMAITINCLGGFYGGHIHAYPCLGFHELNNEGLIGGCECDLRSTPTMVAITNMTEGRPGYISDPVLDTSRRHIIYAHCVASSHVFGPGGPVNPIEIVTHSEDRQGASVRSILPLGYMTTSVEFFPERREVLLHGGKAVANDPDDRACRTKLVVEPFGDFERLFTMWDRWGWHRVTFYGDLREPIRALADALGYSVVEET